MVSKELYKWCPSKMKIHVSTISTPMQGFASMRSTPFMEIDDKGGEVGTKI
jgi:hypothetical protein